MITFLKDILSFAEQFIPSPIALLFKYRFSPADLDIGHCRIAPPSSAALTSPLSSYCSINNTHPRTTRDDNILTTIDILSYNINNVAARSPKRTRRIVHAIVSSGAHVIFLQETNQAWKDILDAMESLQFRYSHFHHPGVTTDREAGGIAILSHYPLENVRVLDFTKDVAGSVFPALTCEVHIPIERSHLDGLLKTSNLSSNNPIVTINIANVHLRPPVELDGSAWLETARKTEPIRINEVMELIQRATSVKTRRIVAKMAAQPPFHIIAGDFNEGDNAGALRHLTSRLGYIDALQQHVPKRKETHTWPFMGNLWTLRKRLDHILWHEGPLKTTFKDGEECNSILQCFGCGVLTGYEDDASDHQPVLSRFAIAKG